MRSLSYDGKMEYQKLNDEMIRANYQHRHVVDEFSDHIKGKKVLDAGCWTGTIEKEISSRNWEGEVVGIDINKAALDVARKNFPEYKFFQLDFAGPDKEFVAKYTDYFDSIIFLDVIEHLPIGTETQVLKFFNRLLKPGGKLILSTMRDHIFNFIDPAWFLGHRHYKTSVLVDMLEHSNFTPNKILEIGNLFWDFDLFLLYFNKHVLHRKYSTPNFIYERILSGLEPPVTISTRVYILAEKK